MNTRRAKVLIIDCHEDVLITFERLLEDEGYDTTTAWTGQDARKAVQGRTFDLVLVNEYLPDMNAEDFISELRRRDRNVPCIVMQPSATQVTNPGRFLAAGAVAVVCKWSQTKVLEVVCEHVSSTTMRPQRREASA
jgi:DNA-binding response OmpR family regulator